MEKCRTHYNLNAFRKKIHIKIFLDPHPQSPCLPPKKPAVVLEAGEKKPEQFSPCPSSTTPSPPPVKEGFINYRNLQLDSERLAKTLCKSKVPKEAEKSVKKNVKKEVPSSPPTLFPERQPQQAQKSTWIPFKLSKSM